MLLAQMLMIYKVYPSPLNNLNYVRAVKQLVKKNPRYKGDLRRAMTELVEVCRTGSERGSYADDDQYYGKRPKLREGVSVV